VSKEERNGKEKARALAEGTDLKTAFAPNPPLEADIDKKVLTASVSVDWG
jgi:hypothetical protein